MLAMPLCGSAAGCTKALQQPTKCRCNNLHFCFATFCKKGLQKTLLDFQRFALRSIRLSTSKTKMSEMRLKKTEGYQGYQRSKACISGRSPLSSTDRCICKVGSDRKYASGEVKTRKGKSVLQRICHSFYWRTVYRQARVVWFWNHHILDKIILGCLSVINWRKVLSRNG